MHGVNVKKSITKFVMAGLLISQTAWADQCPEDVQVINKGQVANCSGLLFSPSASKQMDEAIADSKYFKEVNVKLLQRKELTDKEISVLDQRLKLYMNESQVLATELSSRNSNESFYRFGYLVLGVLAAGYISNNSK